MRADRLYDLMGSHVVPTDALRMQRQAADGVACGRDGGVPGAAAVGGRADEV